MNNSCHASLQTLAPTQPLYKADYIVRDIPLFLAQAMVREHHYAKGGSNTATYCHGLFHRDRPFDCLGIAWWLPPTKNTAIASWDGDWQQVLALSRLVLTPEAPKNAASYLIGQSVKLIKADGRFFCLITYADEWQGHTGGIYRASNWEYLGLTKPTPCWVRTSGQLVAKKSGPHTRSVAEMEALGHRLVGNFPKHKFRLILPKHRRGNSHTSTQLNIDLEVLP